MADDEALRVSSSGSPPWLVIAGEIDESTYPILLAGLAAAEGYHEIRIDLSGVRYCDLAGLQRIVRLTGPSSASGRPVRRVVLHAVPTWLAEILQILGWDTIPGLAVEELLLSGAGRPSQPPGSAVITPMTVQGRRGVVWSSCSRTGTPGAGLARSSATLCGTCKRRRMVTSPIPPVRLPAMAQPAASAHWR
jgi:ABC-type transporter Mla MlaB component